MDLLVIYPRRDLFVLKRLESFDLDFLALNVTFVLQGDLNLLHNAGREVRVSLWQVCMSNFWTAEFLSQCLRTYASRVKPAKFIFDGFLLGSEQ